MDNTTTISAVTLTDIFTIYVTEAGQRVTEEFEFNLDAYTLHGIQVTSDFEDLVFYRGTVGLYLGGFEIAPEEYDAKLLLSGLNVATGDRPQPTSLDVGNNRFEVKYTDTEHPYAAFRPYKVKFTCRLSIDTRAE